MTRATLVTSSSAGLDPETRRHGDITSAAAHSFSMKNSHIGTGELSPLVCFERWCELQSQVCVPVDNTSSPGSRGKKKLLKDEERDIEWLSEGLLEQLASWLAGHRPDVC
ncbi:unnamed protein product [Pleuronectes platessa]|uniref:Uncharacterized protein n=1 Tax=Pleuronectes platessa TaxID=8262 RepID=A0A9N7TSP1_PLEPL|nr:unnamed protein product [Pleuronectes platessa]